MSPSGIVVLVRLCSEGHDHGLSFTSIRGTHSRAVFPNAPHLRAGGRMTMATHVCHLREENGVFSARVRPLDRSAHDSFSVRTGSAELVTDALLAALGLSSGSFASADHELVACVAALRERPFRITLTRRRVMHVEEPAHR